MHAKNKSTNSKLYDIIHSKNNDAEDEENIVEKEIKAKVRLRRSSLYGGGARTHIPKVKKTHVLGGESPNIIGNQDVRLDTLPKVKHFDHSAPPGAHNDQFRIVTNNTTMSANDPDRIFYNSSSMQEGLHNAPQPPWYYGNNNRIKPADGHLIMAAGRYGYRGSQNMNQYNVECYEDPEKTRTKHTPEFLDNGDYINEWVPPILATTHQTVNSLETPKLWPDNTQYPTGYSEPSKNNETPTAWIYKRETTVKDKQRPHTAENLDRMRRTMKGSKILDDTLERCATRESQNTIRSLPFAKQQNFTQEWADKVSKHANSALRTSMNKEKMPYESHTLVDPSDVMKYSGTTAMIVHTQTTDELKFRLRMTRSRSKNSVPFAQRWHHICHHFKEIQHRLKRKETMELALHETAQMLKAVAIKGGSETSVSRVQFINCCNHNSFFDDSTRKQWSIMFSLFDPMKKNSMRFVEFIAALKLLDEPEQSAAEKLAMLWDVYHEYGLDGTVLDLVQDALYSCCYSMEEMGTMEKIYKEEFRPICYSLSLQTLRSRSPSSCDPSTSTTSPGQEASPEPESEVLPNAIHSTDGVAKKSMSFMPQYNVCDHFLNRSTFLDVLKKCPTLVSTFDKYLSHKICMIHGTDPRLKDNELELQKLSMVQDFKWIFAGHTGKTSQFSTGFKPPPKAPSPLP